MMDYILNTFMAPGDILSVKYLMNQGNAVVTGVTSFESAMGLLKLAKKAVRRSDEFEGYPITADGVYFFDGQTGDDMNGEEGPELGADGLPLLATAKKPKAKKKNAKMDTEG